MPIKTKPKKVNPKKIAKERQTLLDEITKDLEEKEVPSLCPSEMGGVLNIDSNYLALPKDLLEIPLRMLGNYLNAYTQNKMYVRTLIGWQQAVVEEAKRNYYDAFYPEYKEISKQKLSETSKVIFVNNAEDVKPHFIVYRNTERKLDLLCNTLSGLEDAIFLISREISLRSSDMMNETRNDNVSRR